MGFSVILSFILPATPTLSALPSSRPWSNFPPCYSHIFLFLAFLPSLRRTPFYTYLYSFFFFTYVALSFVFILFSFLLGILFLSSPYYICLFAWPFFFFFPDMRNLRVNPHPLPPLLICSYS